MSHLKYCKKIRKPKLFEMKENIAELGQLALQKLIFIKLIFIYHTFYGGQCVSLCTWHWPDIAGITTPSVLFKSKQTRPICGLMTVKK